MPGLAKNVPEIHRMTCMTMYDPTSSCQKNGNMTMYLYAHVWMFISQRINHGNMVQRDVPQS